MNKDEVKSNLYEIWLLVRSRLLWLLIFSCVVAGGVYVFNRTLPDKYTAIASFTAPRQTDVLAWVATSDEMLRLMNRQFDLQTRYKAKSMQQLRRIWGENVGVRKTREGFVNISVIDPDPEFAAKMANTIAAMTREEIVRRGLSDAGRLLGDRKILLGQARSQKEALEKTLDEPGQGAAVASIPGIERYALEGVAKTQAETAFAAKLPNDETGRVGIAVGNQEMVRLQSQLLMLQQENGAKQKSRSPEQLKAMDLLQRHVYWRTLAETLGREVARLEGVAVMDLPFDTAFVPDAKSGPDRVYIVILAFVLSLFGSVVALLGYAAWRKDKAMP
ncbi:hypothetical protein RA280_08220 [Cupriavidus sp. CV2]|uniref:hypothetical protein n=1 Tax=Cupriavidus ulmosensis TaxID=3065913 RepID=UPI00296AC307|nr:hypothetical protein [Cupriavidus sp. CV2]MDW3681733.1 hypothetical protein [Cupriavidus sp. CV2]